MEVPSWFLSLAVVLATAFLFLTTVFRRRRAYNLPPGPRPWPVIGNLNLIGPVPHRSIHELSARYGPLMSLRFGAFPVVVGSSADMARFFLKTHDLAFIDRPKTASGEHTLYNGADMLWAPYGAYWRQARRLLQTNLFSESRLRSYEHIRREEVRDLLRGLHGEASAGRAVALGDHLAMLSLSMISRMVLGKKYVAEEADATSAPAVATPEEFRWMVNEFFFLHGALNIGDVIPWLNSLDLSGYIGRMKRLHKKFDRFLEHVLHEHNDRRRREGEGFVARDSVDLLLQLADDPSLEVPISRDGVKALTLDLIAAGTDTSSATLEWAISELLKKPELLGKATEELDRVVGRGRLVTEGDIPSLPYVDAIVKETMRMHPPGPLLAPRLSREDVAVGGYVIPAGTRVLVNVWAIGRDPALWDAPDEFRPERFAGSEIDVKGQHFELLPFGSGRRMCPGYALGLRMIQVSLANLLHGFAWRLPDGVAAAELSMEEKSGLYMSVPRKVPLQAVAEPKLPAHLYTTGE